MNVSIRSNKGFSLVELMVVVAIIGILAAIAVPNFQRFTAKSKQSEAKASLSALYSAERGVVSEWQVYNSSFSVLGYRPSGWVRYNHGFSSAAAAMPVGYSGPPADALISTQVAGVCGLGAMNAATGCGVINAPVVPGAISALGAVPAAVPPTFVAEARAHIGAPAAATVDVWTINQFKVYTNVTNGLP